MIYEIARKAGRFAKCLAGTDRIYTAEYHCPSVTLGDPHACFTVNPQLLGPASIAYSFGIGTNVSFDLGLIERFGVEVHAFDPTQRSQDWVRTQSLPSRLHIHTYGIAASDGAIILHPPKNPAHVSFSIVRHGEEGAVSYPVFRLGTIVRMLGHSRIDLLKLDVEGCEYEVIDDLTAFSQFSIPQICIEFHHRWSEIGIRKTEEGISTLHSLGYRIFHVSPSGNEFSFIRQRADEVFSQAV